MAPSSPVARTSEGCAHLSSLAQVVLELSQVLAVVPCPSRMNPSDKYIQVLTTAGHELWFMGFVSYEKAVKNMTEALQQRPPATAGSGISPTTI